MWSITIISVSLFQKNSYEFSYEKLNLQKNSYFIWKNIWHEIENPIVNMLIIYSLKNLYDFGKKLLQN